MSARAYLAGALLGAMVLVGCEKQDTKPSPQGTSGVKDPNRSTYSVVLQGAGPNKIQVIKAVRDATGLGLKESKDLVEGAPKTVKQDLTRDQAEQLKKTLEAVGAQVEIK